MAEKCVGGPQDPHHKTLAPRPSTVKVSSVVQNGEESRQREGQSRRRPGKPRPIACQSCRQSKVRVGKQFVQEHPFSDTVISCVVRILREGHALAEDADISCKHVSWTSQANEDRQGRE
jgi:hypothetical protein